MKLSENQRRFIYSKYSQPYPHHIWDVLKKTTSKPPPELFKYWIPTPTNKVINYDNKGSNLLYFFLVVYFIIYDNILLLL